MADNSINNEEIVEATTSDVGVNESLTQVNDNRPKKQKSSNSAFKCIAVLLAVLMVCGIFLTIMNSLLLVTDQERFDRAIKKIYGKSVTTTSLVVENYNSNAEIVEAYRIKDDGNYLVKSTGKGGWENGTVTCWVVVEVGNTGVTGIGKVVIDSNTKQSYISRVTNKALAQFGELYTDGIYYSPDLITNATVASTKNALCNAVNGALDYVKAKLGIVAEDLYEGLPYTEYISTKQTSHVVNEDGTVTFSIVTGSYGEAQAFSIDVTVGADGKIKAYVITKNGSTGGFDGQMNKLIKDGSLFVGLDLAGIQALLNTDMTYPSGKNPDLSTGATKSNYLCFYAAAFAAANYSKFLPEPEPPVEGGDENPDEGETGNPENPDGGDDNNEQGGNE